MVNPMNAEPLQIVIHASATHKVVEAFWEHNIPARSYTHLSVEPAEFAPAEECTVWSFSDYESAFRWLMLRARCLSREGIDVSTGEEGYPDSCKAMWLDDRTWQPFHNYRHKALKQMMEW